MSTNERAGLASGTDRRGALKIGALGVLAASLPTFGLPGAARAQPGSATAAGAGPKRIARLAHLTDTHIQPERGGAEGVAECLRAVMSLEDRADFVLTGGDLIMDGFAADEARTKLQWELWTKAFADECGIPVEHCLGNHDIWGWGKQKSRTTGSEARWGKRWAMDVLGLEKPYRAFDRGPWRVIVLDSVHPHGNEGYIGKLDGEQLDWLDGELKGAGRDRHVMVVSHIPIISISALIHDSNVSDDRWELSGGNMHIDALEIKRLFDRYGNVRLCLSGHIHKVDRCDYEGVTYICDGAVSGAWWQGRKDRCDEGFGVVDLFDNGTFAHAYRAYGWQPRE